jgi:hypothetical protein
MRPVGGKRGEREGKGGTAAYVTENEKKDSSATPRLWKGIDSETNNT